MYSLTQKYVLHALHNLNNPDWSDQQNLEAFGKCYRLHGHDFHFAVTVQGEPDKDSGFCYSREKMDTIVDETILNPFTGKNLNEFFEMPSGEGLVVGFYEKLKKQIGDALVCVSLRETPKNFFTYPK